MAGMNNGSEEQIDPRVAELLETLRDLPARQPQAQDRSRARFLAELDALPSPNPSLSVPKEGFKMFSTKKRFVLSSLVFIAVALLFVFGGSALTVLASQSALPGDRLYPIKTSMEQTRSSFSRDAGDRAELYIEFAGRRLEEIELLIVEGRFRNVAPTTLEFEMHVQNALLEIDTVAAQDPERAAQLLARITQSLVRYANALSLMVDDVPDSVRAEMLRALRAARLAGGIDNENENANTNDNLNENRNDNANLNENANVNDNANANHNGNDNESMAAPTATRTRAPTSTKPPAPTATLRPTQQPVLNDNDNDNHNDNDNFNDNDNSDDRSTSGGTCSLGSTTVDDFTVPSNTTCTLNGTRVKGNIFVRANATLIASGVTVDGNIQADGAARVEVRSGSYVDGNIQVDYSGSLVVSGVRVNGNLQAFNNWGSQSYASNRIGGDLQAFDNKGGVSIQNNTIGGNLQCKSNSPAPVGGSNSVSGNKEDQCAGL
jgi:cytoskeletal protein CcmA (bactofilin family)